MQIPLTLFQQYYFTTDPVRQAEIDYALSKNCKNKYFDNIVIFVDNLSVILPFKARKRITLVQLYGRLTFADWIRHSFELCPSGLSLLANSDIMFDSSIRHIKTMKSNECFAAISRHEHFRLAINPSLTQDAWAFNPSQASIVNKPHFIHSTHIPLGFPGCENRMAAIAEEAGLRLINPCQHVFAHHIHLNQSRNYNETHRILGTYTFVSPGIVDQRLAYSDGCSYNLASMQSSCSRVVFDHHGLKAID